MKKIYPKYSCIVKDDALPMLNSKKGQTNPIQGRKESEKLENVGFLGPAG